MSDKKEPTRSNNKKTEPDSVKILQYLRVLDRIMARSHLGGAGCSLSSVEEAVERLCLHNAQLQTVASRLVSLRCSSSSSSLHSSRYRLLLTSKRGPGRGSAVVAGLDEVLLQLCHRSTSGEQTMEVRLCVLIRGDQVWTDG